MAEQRPVARRCPIDVFRYQDYRTFLADFYAAKKQRRGFSYRAFAKAADLGAPNYLKLVITRKRNLSDAVASRFAQACGLGDEASDYFVTLVRFNQAKNDEEREPLYRQLRAFRRYRRAHKLELAEAAYHSTWYIPAIRELVCSSFFRDDAEWIAGALRPAITAREAQSALDVLLQLGLLQRNKQGRLIQHNKVVSTGAETAGMHIRKYHGEMMQRASSAMEDVPQHDRDISSLTMCLGSETLGKLKERLAAFRRELVELCTTDGAPTRVVQLNFQLFPLSADTAAHHASSAPLKSISPSPIGRPSKEKKPKP